MTITLLWVGLSVLATVAMATMVLVSEYQKQPNIPRLFWLRIITFAGFAPVSLFVPWPSDPVFYTCVIALSLLICGSDALYYGSARDHGAGVTTRIEPLSVLMTFVLWIVVSPGMMDEYLSKPLISAGIVGCFAAAGYFALRLRHCAVSFAVMKRISPVILIMAVTGVLGKMAMDAGGPDHFASVVAYLVIQCAIVIFFYAALFVLKPSLAGSPRPNRSLLLSAAAMALCSVTHISTKNIAYAYVENPAYVTMIGLSAPLFVAGFYHLTKRRDDTDRVAGFGIVISALILVILTHF